MPLNLIVPSLNFHARQSPTSRYSCLQKAINEGDNKLISRTSFSSSQTLCGFVLCLLQPNCKLKLKIISPVSPAFLQGVFSSLPCHWTSAGAAGACHSAAHSSDRKLISQIKKTLMLISYTCSCYYFLSHVYHGRKVVCFSISSQGATYTTPILSIF